MTEGMLEDHDGTPALRFERHYPHPRAKVWRAVTDPAELAHWFPAEVRTTLEPGAPIQFLFPGEPADDTDPNTTGEVLEVDPPRLFAFRWNSDVLRFELAEDGDGTRLTFLTLIGGGPIGRLGSARSGAGWELCLEALAARLDDRPAPADTGMLPRIEGYIARFGLGDGELRETVDGTVLAFTRDLVWRPADAVWELLTGGEPPQPGDRPPLPATHGYVDVGPVIEADAPRTLSYEWRHEDEPAGTVRWHIIADPVTGTRIELTQSVPEHLAGLRPTLLAAWHTHLELFFAALLGDVRCPWPTERTEHLTRDYTARLAGP